MYAKKYKKSSYLIKKLPLTIGSFAYKIVRVAIYHECKGWQPAASEEAVIYR